MHFRGNRASSGRSAERNANALLNLHRTRMTAEFDGAPTLANRKHHRAERSEPLYTVPLLVAVVAGAGERG